MDNKSNRPGETGDYIWLRYATQIPTDNERSQTVEMNVPMPIGASAEQRERLLREAEDSFAQLVHHVKQRIPQIMQRSLSQSPPTSRPEAQAPTRPTNRPASAPAPQTAPQSSQIRESAPEMPSDPGRDEVEGRATLSLPEFIQLIRENMSLTPPQAMQLLKVRSLTTGINLREAYERLRYLVAKETPRNEPPAQPASARSQGEPTNREAEQKTPQANPGLPAGLHPSLRPASELSAPVRPASRKAEDEDEDEDEYYAMPTGFDEEDGPGGALSEDEDEEEGGLTPRLRERAWDVIARMRDAHGSTSASQQRLQALRNVLDGQIDSAQLQALIEGLWNINSAKRLKVDQVEALIYWAKEDEFVSEAEAALQILEEEDYARGNR